MYTVRIISTTAENGYSYNHFSGEGRHRSPKVAMRLARESIGRDYNRNPSGAAAGAVYDRITIRRGPIILLDKEVW